MDLSRLRSIVRSSRDVLPAGGATHLPRELTYEPDTGGYEAGIDLGRIAEILGGRPRRTPFGECLVIDRRYESDRRHGGVNIRDCELPDGDVLRLLDPSFAAPSGPRAVFIDLETTGLSGGAGTVAFLVGCGYFDAGAFQVRQFLLTSHAAERALLDAVAEFLRGAELIVTYNGKTFDVPVMETRWSFHRMEMPDFTTGGLPHFDMLHPARRLWSGRGGNGDGGCRLTTLERILFGVRRVGDVPGCEIPSRFFQFLRSGNPRPLEPVLEHNRLDLVSLAAVTARAGRLAHEGVEACGDETEALALGRVYERAGAMDRAEACYRRASSCTSQEVRAESLYRLGLRYRRERRFEEAAAIWRDVLALTDRAGQKRLPDMTALRQFAAEALAVHHEHRARDLPAARELALFALEEAGERRRADGIRHRLARLDRKILKERELPFTPLQQPAASLLLPPACGSPTSGRRTAS